MCEILCLKIVAFPLKGTTKLKTQFYWMCDFSILTFLGSWFLLDLATLVWSNTVCCLFRY